VAWVGEGSLAAEGWWACLIGLRRVVLKHSQGWTWGLWTGLSRGVGATLLPRLLPAGRPGVNDCYGRTASWARGHRRLGSSITAFCSWPLHAGPRIEGTLALAAGVGVIARTCVRQVLAAVVQDRSDPLIQPRHAVETQVADDHIGVQRLEQRSACSPPRSLNTWQVCAPLDPFAAAGIGLGRDRCQQARVGIVAERQPLPIPPFPPLTLVDMRAAVGVQDSDHCVVFPFGTALALRQWVELVAIRMSMAA